LVRVLERLGLADVYGRSRVPLYVMNVAYPVVDAEVLRFCQGKRAVLLVEEGQPNFVEQNVATVLRQAGCSAVLHGKDLLPPAGEYTVHEVLKGVRAFAQKYGLLDAVQSPSGTGLALTKSAPLSSVPMPAKAHKVIALKPLQQVVQPRPPGFCTGCPERPIFAAMTLAATCSPSCRLFTLATPPWAMAWAQQVLLR
jgi:indolepyruvate ferredoxin oxidoreductase alpha subunit